MQKALKLLLFIWPIFFGYINLAQGKCSGKFVNPITDINWECVFPLTIAGMNITPSYKDYHSYNKKICSCAGTPPKIGVPISFWEPTRLIDVTQSPYCLVGLGGIQLGAENIRKRGVIANVDNTPGSTYSYYHVHWYVYPVLHWLELLVNFICIETGEFDLAYMSEFDPLWDDGNLSAILNAESIVFANKLAITACLADCASSSLDNPSDKMFWCAGCNGSIYPLTGTVAGHIGHIESSFLLVQRIIAKLHRMALIKGFEQDEFCEASYMPFYKKTLYKTHLVYPKLDISGLCRTLGCTTSIWGSGKSYPVYGEDFCYLVWSKKHCCLDAVRIIGATQAMKF
jgi:conjugal transfer pilus assembly protein TraU